MDVFGTLLIAAGIFFLVSDGETLAIPADEFRGPAIAMIVVGAMLMVPLIVAVIRRAGNR